MGDYQHDFQRKLINIKSRNIQAVAARMCNILLEFPRHYATRKVTRRIGEQNVTMSTAGTVFDSVWEENVGSLFCCVDGLDIKQAKIVIEHLYMLSQFISKHGNMLIGKADELESYADDFAALKESFETNKLVELSHTAKLEESKFTYAQLGYFLNQTTLNEEFHRDAAGGFDLYDFGKFLIDTDIITQQFVVHNLVDTENWKHDIPPKYRGDAATIDLYARAIFVLDKLVSEIVVDISHKVDGIAACAALGSYDREDVKREEDEEIDLFDPEKGTLYKKIALPEPDKNINAFKISFPDWYKMAFVVHKPVRLLSVSIEGTEVDFALTSSTDDQAIYMTGQFRYDADAVVKYQAICNIEEPDTPISDVDLKKIKPYLSRIYSAGSGERDITTEKVNV